VKGLLASPRRRRRAVWLAVVAAAAATVTVLAVFYPNTSPTRHGAPFTKEPVQHVAPNPATVKFTARDRKDVVAVAGRFIATAVYRRHVGDSYDLVVPSFHQGLSRKQWQTGNVPVPPYPGNAVALLRWKLDYSYRNRVGMRVAFMPKPTAKVGGIVYAIELRNVGSSAHHHWLVSYWTPLGQEVLSQAQRKATAGPPVEAKPQLGAAWIFVVIGSLLGLIVLVPVVLALRGWRMRRRVDRAYRALTP
jgi:hypothetical protein